MVMMIFAAQAGDSELRLMLDRGTFPVAEERLAARAQREWEYERLKELIANGPCEGSVILHRMADVAFAQGRDLTLTGDVTAARPWLERSVKLHRQLLVSAPSSVEPDEAVHSIGVALLAMDATQEGIDSLSRLIQEHPDSPYAPDAYTRLGDVWFARGDASKSQAAYERAEAARDPTTWRYARYMLDWCLFNVGEKGRALEGHLALAALPANEPFARHLRVNVFTDLPRFFAESGRVQEGRDYFRAVGRPDLAEAMEALLQTAP